MGINFTFDLLRTIDNGISLQIDECAKKLVKIEHELHKAISRTNMLVQSLRKKSHWEYMKRIAMKPLLLKQWNEFYSSVAIEDSLRGKKIASSIAHKLLIEYRGFIQEITSKGLQTIDLSQ